MRRIVAVGGLAFSLAAASWGGEDERDRVERYVGQANAVQQRSAGALARANEAYRRFSEGELAAPVAERELIAAEDALRRTREELTRLRPPAEATALHSGLLRVYDLNAALAGETTRLGRYLPAVRRDLRPVRRTTARLRARLRAAREPEEQAVALDRYAASIGGRDRALRRLDPPPVVFTTHQAQLRRLERSATLARRLAQATRERDSARVARTLLRFRRVTRETGGQALTRRAVREYRERYADLADAAVVVRREQQRLEQQLG